MKKKRIRHDYVDNKKLYQAMKDYMAQVREAEEQGDPRPRVSEYIGEAIWLISYNMAKKPNFAGYSYKDEMIADGVENVMMYIHNYDETKRNPFAYFSMIIHNAFLRRIDKEKKQLYIRHKMVEKCMIHGQLVAQAEESRDVSGDSLINDYMNDFVENYEANLKRKKERSS